MCVYISSDILQYFYGNCPLQYVSYLSQEIVVQKSKCVKLRIIQFRC